ncbi:MAG: hypothetical protein J7502_01270 [Flavisolibacter sp.]|nr:hypothetical protein [Flavisolibacter sp.]
MKRIQLLILFTTMVFCCQGQKKTKPGDTTHHVMITYDFFSTDPLKIMRWTNKGKLDTMHSLDVRKLYYGDKINFRVRVNPFLYDVKVNGNNVFENSPLDTAYVKTLVNFLGQQTGSPLPQKNSPADTAKKNIGEAPQAEKKLDLSTNNNKLLVQKALNLPNLPKKEDTTRLKIKAVSEYDSLRKQLGHTEHNIDSFFKRYQDEKNMLGQVLLLSLTDYKEYDAIISEINSYLSFMQGPDFTIDSLKKSTNFYVIYYQREAKRESLEMVPTFQRMSVLHKIFDISTYQSDSTLFQYYNDLADSLQRDNLSQFSGAYVAFLQNLGNRNLFEKSYSPDFATADSFRFQLELHPSGRARDFISLYKLSLRDTIFKPYTLPVKRVLKLNLSVGLAFMFGGAVPYTYYYSTPKDQLSDSDLVFIKKGAREAAVVPRIALLTHLYWTNANWIKPAITFGLSTNPADPAETAYMGGASLIMGHNRRMIFTAGVALANTNVLKSRYKTDDAQIKEYYTSIEEAALVEKKLKFGGFAGISYNF